MAVKTGRITKIGCVSGPEPAGRITILEGESTTNAGTEAVIQVDTTSKRWDVARFAIEQQRQVQIDVLATNNPFIADKVQMI